MLTKITYLNIELFLLSLIHDEVSSLLIQLSKNLGK